jgi:DNA-binding MarR family transcriptional regulator
MVSAKDLAGCVCFNLRKAARAVTQHYDAVLAPAGLKATQFSVLAVLSVADSTPLSKAADLLGMDRTTLTRNLRPLERNSWIRSSRSPDDGRERLLGLTRSGRSAFETALPLWHKAQDGMVQQIGRTRWDGLRRVVGGVASATDAESRSTST